MRLITTVLAFSVAGCSALGLPNHGVDGGSNLQTGGGSGGGGTSSTGGGAGGGGGFTQTSFDAGWPATALAASAITETVLPGYSVYLGHVAIGAWNDRVFVSQGDGSLLEIRGDAIHTVATTLQRATDAIRPFVGGPAIVSLKIELCGADCLDGGAPSQALDLNESPSLTCRGPGPLTVQDSFGVLSSYLGGQWVARSPPFQVFIGPENPCRSNADGTLLVADSRITRVGLDGGSASESPRVDGEQFTDFVQSGFGLLAIGAAEEVFVNEGSSWRQVARRASNDPNPEVWFRAVALPDGRVVAIGTHSLSVISDGAIRTWQSARGTLQSSPESIDVGLDGTVWVAGHFTPAGSGDAQDLIIGYHIH